MKNIAILKQRFGEVSQSVPISEGLRFGKDSKQQKTVMDRLLRLSGASLDGMGGAQQPADAPVVDTAEQVSIKLSLCCTGNCNNYFCSSSFSTYLVYISSLALLKMLKHGRAGVPMEVMGLMLGEFVNEYTGEVEICPLYPPIYSGLVLDNRLVS